MRFVVPQFIEVEDKIIGPLSVRQFLIFLSGFGAAFISYKIFSFIIFIILFVFILGACGVFAFANINGQMFHYFLLNIITTFKRPNLKVWRKELNLEEAKKSKKSIKTAHLVKPTTKIVSRSRLAELTLVVDTGGAYKEEDEQTAIKLKK